LKRRLPNKEISSDNAEFFFFSWIDDDTAKPCMSLEMTLVVGNLARKEQQKTSWLTVCKL